MLIREMHPADWPALHAAYTDLMPEMSHELIGHRLRGPAGLMLVCERQHQFAGFCELKWLPDERMVWVNTLEVEAAHRRQGIASLLLREAESRAARWGGRQVALDVLTNNPEAGRLYETSGYACTGEVHDNFSGRRKFRYCKDITPASHPDPAPACPGRLARLLRRLHYALRISWPQRLHATRLPRHDHQQPSGPQA